MYLIDIGSMPISFAATASIATWSALASITFLTCGTMQRGPGPSPAKVPSITANTPRWIFFWIISRSTSVSWITGWVQCRFSFSSPPNAFFIAPVVVVKTCVFTVGRWRMFSPMNRLRDHEPVGVDLVQAEELVGEIADRVADVDPGLVAFVEVDVAQAVRLHHRQLLVLRLAEVRVDDDGAVVAGVDQRRDRSRRCFIARITPSSCHGVVERAGEEEMPGDVDLERGIGVLGEDVLVAGQVHHRVRVPADRRRRGLKKRNR